MREAHTAVVERRARLGGTHATEPYEVAWAGELIYFVYTAGPAPRDVTLLPQISADGQRWVDDGDPVVLPAGRTGAVVRRRDFGSWSRLVLDVPGPDAMDVDVYLALKE